MVNDLRVRSTPCWLWSEFCWIEHKLWSEPHWIEHELNRALLTVEQTKNKDH